MPICSGCGRIVAETRKPHRVDRTHLADQVAVDADSDEVPVYGWHCDRCSRVLALDPEGRANDLGPGSGWLAVGATLANGDRGPVLVPQEVVLG